MGEGWRLRRWCKKKREQEKLRINESEKEEWRTKEASGRDARKGGKQIDNGEREEEKQQDWVEEDG